MKDYWNSISTGRKIRLILGLILGILLLIFAIQNRKPVFFSVVFTKFEISLTLLIILSMFVGFLIASLFDYKKFKEKDKTIADLKAKIQHFLTDKGNKDFPTF